MDNKLLLVTSAALLFRESQLDDKSTNSKDIVRTVLEGIKVTDLNLTVNHERDVITNLKTTLLEMCSSTDDTVYEAQELLARVKMNTGEDEKLYESFFNIISPELTEPGIKRSVISRRKALNHHFREQEFGKIINTAQNTFKYKRESIGNLNKFVSELCGALEPFQVDAITKDPAVISEVDVGDENSTANIFKEVKAVDDGTGIMRTGFQGINRMLQGGFRRGDCIVLGALQHNYKTGFSLTVFKQVALYNVPNMINPAKKPLLIRISFEDDLSLNMQFLYQSLKENETGVKAEIGNVTEAEMSAYVKEKLQVTGFHVKLLRVDPTQWTYRHICNKVLEYEAEGYEIHMLMLDYLAMVPTTGCSIGPMGSDLRDMFRRMRNFCSPRKITLITPHQLSTEAKQLIRDGRTDFVKEIANLGYYDKCRTIDNEVDIEIYFHIVKVNGRSYLTIQRGKHRLPTIIPDELKYIVLPMYEVCGIPDDINGADTTCRKPGGGPIGGGEETPFWSPT
jgi:DnaB-like helicase C terminal domain